MTRLSFTVLCGELNLDPGFLIDEDEGLQELLMSREPLEVVRLYLVENY